MHCRWDGKTSTSSENPAKNAIDFGSIGALVETGADVVVKGGVRGWWICEGLAGRTETFNSSTLVASSKGGTVTISGILTKERGRSTLTH